MKADTVCLRCHQKCILTAEAMEITRDTNTLPLVTGRVCHHPCELTLGFSNPELITDRRPEFAPYVSPIIQGISKLIRDKY